MPNIRKKALEDFAKDVEMGIPLAEDYVGKTSDIYDDALRARNLAEDALAQKVLDNTGIPIPDKTSPLSKKEDFLNQLLKERYPELKKPIKIEDLDDAAGLYSDGNIILNKKSIERKSPQRMAADLFHEAGHAYDDIKKITPEITQDDFNKELRKLKASGFDLKNADPAQVYELIAQKHHAQIPKLREGTFGLGALKSYLKSGTFKGIAPLLVKGAAIGAGGLATLAAEAADSSEEGSSREQSALLRERNEQNFKNKLMSQIPEENRQAVEKDFEDRNLGLKRTALEKLLGR